MPVMQANFCNFFSQTIVSDFIPFILALCQTNLSFANINVYFYN